MYNDDYNPNKRLAEIYLEMAIIDLRMASLALKAGDEEQAKIYEMAHQHHMEESRLWHNRVFGE